MDNIATIKDRFLEKKSHRVIASYSYIPLIGWVIPLFEKKDDPLCQHHARQGFLLAIIFFFTASLLNIANIFVLQEWYEVRVGLVITIYALYAFYAAICFIFALLTLRGKIFNFPFFKRLIKYIEL